MNGLGKSNMKPGIHLVSIFAVVLLLVGARLTILTRPAEAPPRPQGPCDIYGAAGTACVAAHSTTRALYAAYKGPLYQVKRVSDGKTLNIGVVEGSGAESGGYANAAAQDTFCENTICLINVVFDQSGKGNHLYQAPPGPQFPGPAKGAFDAQPIADMAPITIGGHKVYGVYIMPGMGFRNNNATEIAINDEPEGIYYVIDGTHYDSGCCFDYGNSSTNGRAVGTGTMETTYFGTATAWGSGNGPGPWIMADMEAGLFSGYNAKQNIADPTIDSWRFVTAFVDGGGGNKWDLRGGNAQKGALTTFYNGARPGSPNSNSYYPMHKQGGILLGTGGDNGNGSSGTFYEGVMTAGYPVEATTDAVQANIVNSRYDVPRVSLSRIVTFTPKSTQEVVQKFTNIAATPAMNVKLSISTPAGWNVSTSAGTGSSLTFDAPLAPGASVSATFKVTSASVAGGGFISGRAEWMNTGVGSKQLETTSTKVRNVLPIKINEVRLNTSTNPSDQFIELYNASNSSADISNWTLVNTQSQWAPVKLTSIPAGTKLESGAYYLLGLSNSGLSAPSSAGSANINVRSTTGFANGQQMEIDGEIRIIKSLGTAATAMTTVFAPVSTGPWITIPAGSTSLPVANAAGFVVGEKIGIDVGGNFELATVTSVGKAATQATLASAAMAGATNIKVAASANISAGDTLTLGTGKFKELVKVKSAGANGAGESGIDLQTSLKFDHMSGIDVSDVGTGIGFLPATRFPHVSGDAVQALGSGITLDKPLTRSHAYGAPVVNAVAATDGYQGPKPHQWYGGPLSPRAGSIALLDPNGLVVDAIVYGSQQSSSSANGFITSPELAILEADQGKGGCIAVVPTAGRGGGAASAGAINRSVFRFPDGRDTDTLCTDFRTQAVTSLATASPANANNIKVASVTDFAVGQSIMIDTGANTETAVIATIGTAGGSTVGAATTAGATVIPVASATGFAAGQSITVDSGTNQETAIIASTTGGRGGATITIATPLRFAHAVGSSISGSGITLKASLTKTHAAGAQVAGGTPTPGSANQY